MLYLYLPYLSIRSQGDVREGKVQIPVSPTELLILYMHFLQTGAISKATTTTTTRPTTTNAAYCENGTKYGLSSIR